MIYFYNNIRLFLIAMNVVYICNSETRRLEMPVYEYQDIYDWMKQNKQRKRPPPVVEVLPQPQAHTLNQLPPQKKIKKFPLKRKKVYRKRYGMHGAHKMQFRERNKMSKTSNIIGRRNVFGEKTNGGNQRTNRHHRPHLRINGFKRLTTASPEIESIRFNINKIIAPLSPNTGLAETNLHSDPLNTIKTDSPEIESIKFNINKIIAPLSPKIDLMQKKHNSLSTKMNVELNVDDVSSNTGLNEGENIVLDNINIDHSDRAKNHKMLDSKSKKTLEPVNKSARTKFELQQKPKLQSKPS